MKNTTCASPLLRQQQTYSFQSRVRPHGGTDRYTSGTLEERNQPDQEGAGVGKKELTEQVFHIRYGLQKGLLSKDKNKPPADMKAMNNYLSYLEALQLPENVITETKIIKVLRLASRSVSQSEELQFEARCKQLIQGYEKILEHTSRDSILPNNRGSGDSDSIKAAHNQSKSDPQKSSSPGDEISSRSVAKAQVNTSHAHLGSPLTQGTDPNHAIPGHLPSQTAGEHDNTCVPDRIKSYLPANDTPFKQQKRVVASSSRRIWKSRLARGTLVDVKVIIPENDGEIQTHVAQIGKYNPHWSRSHSIPILWCYDRHQTEKCQGDLTGWDDSWVYVPSNHKDSVPRTSITAPSHIISREELAQGWFLDVSGQPRLVPGKGS
ncbi:hypothetical protein LTR92_011500 [Exophiala xenobiotica]|nr:hypothetical protein LTR92_011500 [Exophiala xenobiotica]KAK5432234.1 hypothetical protein LTR18_011259 [Exophiala xenobiotica]